MTSIHLVTLLRTILSQVIAELAKPWEPPSVTAQLILELFRSSASPDETVLPRVMVTGAPDSQLLCLVDVDQVLFYTPYTGLETHPFIREIVHDCDAHFETHPIETGTCLTTILSPHLEARLALPSVLLVSLFHPEMYPASRLTLGISYLASYLRLHALAHVEIIDCQFGAQVDDILVKIQTSHPNILGVAVNFGQFDLLEQLLQRIYGDSVTGKEPVVILGNILPAMNFREILTTYPRVVICRKEGELALAELVRSKGQRSKLSNIPGIHFLDLESGKLISTSAKQFPLEELPPPALDTVQDLFIQEGVITAEFSRGCQYNICSFCPRTHKGSIWRTMPVSSMVRQWKMFSFVFRSFQRTPHVFLADEDFVGIDDGEAIKRLVSFLDQAHASGCHITFDASARADQVFRENANRAWHISRGELFRRCLAGGLSRLFLGVESGASAQLIRYNKGSTVHEMASSIRYLSLLGVQLRFGFIFFDPLMSIKDLVENIEFLGRTDVVLSMRLDASVEDLFTLVASYHQQVIPYMTGQAIYENVSYMVSPLEVLAKSRYLFDLRQQAPQLINERIDATFARYCTAYAIPEIGTICQACQYWVNYCFPIVYALKGLQKVSQGEEKNILLQAITGHRYLGYMLIRSLTKAFSLVDKTTVERWKQAHPEIEGEEDLCQATRGLIKAGHTEVAISTLLSWYGVKMQQLMGIVNTHVFLLSAPKQQSWRKAYYAWLDQPIAKAQRLRVF